MNHQQQYYNQRNMFLPLVNVTIGDIALPLFLSPPAMNVSPIVTVPPHQLNVDVMMINGPRTWEEGRSMSQFMPNQMQQLQQVPVTQFPAHHHQYHEGRDARNLTHSNSSSPACSDDDSEKGDDENSSEAHNLWNAQPLGPQTERRTRKSKVKQTNCYPIIPRNQMVDSNNGFISGVKIGTQEQSEEQMPALPFVTPAQVDRNPTFLSLTLAKGKRWATMSSITLEVLKNDRNGRFWETYSVCQIQGIGSIDGPLLLNLTPLGTTFTRPWLRVRVICDTCDFILCYLGYANGGNRVERSNRYLADLFQGHVPQHVTQAMLHELLGNYERRPQPQQQ